jgi:hypothetical protein
VSAGEPQIRRQHGGTGFQSSVPSLGNGLLALGFLETSAKAQDQVQLFPGALKHSSPRMNAGAPTSLVYPPTLTWHDRLTHPKHM